MPRATARRSGREPKPGSRFPSQILADNVRIWRDLRRMSQADLAERMTRLGHPWSETIAGFVERGQRNVTVDELVGLTLALQVGRFGALLDPLGPEGEHRFGPPGPRAREEGNGLDWGGPTPLPGEAASDFLRSKAATGWHVAFEFVTGEPVPPEKLQFVMGYASVQPLDGEELR